MAAPVAHNKLPRASKALDRLITGYELRGLSGVEIAAALAAEHAIVMTHQAVSSRIRQMNRRSGEAREEKIAQHERLLMWVGAEAMDAWERSQLDKETEITEQVQLDEGEGGEEGDAGSPVSRLKAMVKKEGQVGDAAYLNVVVKVSESIRKLRGLDAPTAIRQETPPPVDWALVPEEMQVAFAEGSMSLADVIRYLARG